jgi:hypothetical protein
MYFTYVFLALSFQLAFGNYGYYCKPNAVNGPVPVDGLDSICQVNSLCTKSLGQTSCFCTEQLMFNLLGFSPTTLTQQMYRNNTLASLSLHGCPIFQNVQNTYYFPGCEDAICPFRGSTYLPIFGYSTNLLKNLVITGLINSIVYSTSLTNYNNIFLGLASTYPADTYLHFTSVFTPVNLGTYTLPQNKVLLFMGVNSLKYSSVQFTTPGYTGDVLLHNCTQLCQNAAYPPNCPRCPLWS